MKKNQINVRELVQKYQANCARISEIADACEKEQRERNEAENKEFEALTRENQLLGMRMQAATADYARENPDAGKRAVQILRENAAAGRQSEVIFVREGEFAGMMVSDAVAGALVPLNIGDIIKPLEEGFILDKVGLPMPTGLVGDYVWPTYEAVDATIAGEGVALADTKIDLNKLTAAPERIGIAIPITNQALNQSAGVLELIIREVMPKAVRRLLNQILFSPVAVNNATHLVGPLAKIIEVAAKTEQQKTDEEKKYAAVVDLHDVPTAEELNKKMKAAVLGTGIEGDHLCWVMTKATKAMLEITPINSEGIFVPMIQNDTLFGLPVYTTNCVKSGNNEYILLGDFAYQPMGLFGTIRFIVDPFSQARRDAVDFVLNCDYGTKTLRPEAFIAGQVGSAS